MGLQGPGFRVDSDLCGVAASADKVLEVCVSSLCSGTMSRVQDSEWDV